MNRKGFTLIELMLVVIIIGVLVSMVMPRLVGRSEEARTAACRADINANIATALDLYELDNGKYPPGLETLLTKTPAGKGPYLKREPLDPWGRKYLYRSPGEHNNDYDLYSYGPDGVDGGGDDVANWQSESK
jgi:general secretion pathway protein G